MEKNSQERDFEQEVNDILGVFKSNILKACLIWGLKEEHIAPLFKESLMKPFEDLKTLYGVENIAKSQTLVMMVTSFEAYVKDLFRTSLYWKEDLLKRVLKKIDTKWSSQDLANILSKEDILIELIIDRQNLNFQNIDSLKRALDLIEIDLEDQINKTESEIAEFTELSRDFHGESFLREVFSKRHKIVHEGEVALIDDSNINLIMIFFQELAVLLAEKFCTVRYELIEGKFYEEKSL